jgi:TonB family protein
MEVDLIGKNSVRFSKAGRKLLHAAVLALLVMLVLPAKAEDRTIRTRVAPIYPEIARRMKIAGLVEVEATVDAEGNVSDAKAVGGSKILAPAAEDAVRKWKFASGSGTAKLKVQINFALN